MGEKMTLVQVRDQIAAVATEDDYMLQGWIAALDFHLTQPAQAVDVGAIQRVIDELRGYCEASDDSCYGTLSTSLVRDYADKLTAAIPNANGKEG